MGIAHGRLCCFLSPIEKLLENPYHRLRELFAVTGLLLIASAMVFLDPRIIPAYPNAFTLIPTVGTLLIVLFGTRETWIGLISYSAYLWHQPILVFLRFNSKPASDTVCLTSAFVMIFLLAILTYRLIETPFRDRSYLTSKQVFRLALSVVSVLFAIALILLRIGLLRSHNLDEADRSGESISFRDQET